MSEINHPLPLRFRQHQDKEREFKEQLGSLNSLLPAIHTHLVTGTTFATEASKYEFLEQGYVSNKNTMSHLLGYFSFQIIL